MPFEIMKPTWICWTGRSKIRLPLSPWTQTLSWHFHPLERWFPLIRHVTKTEDTANQLNISENTGTHPPEGYTQKTGSKRSIQFEEFPKFEPDFANSAQPVEKQSGRRTAELDRQSFLIRPTSTTRRRHCCCRTHNCPAAHTYPGSN